MKVSWMGIGGFAWAIVFLYNLVAAPDFGNLSKDGIEFFFWQMCFYVFMTTVLFVADTFYLEIKKEVK